MPFGFTGFASNGPGTANIGVSYLSPSLWGDVDTDLVAKGLGQFQVQHFDSDPVVFAPFTSTTGSSGGTVFLGWPTGIKCIRGSISDISHVLISDSATANHSLSIALGATATTTTKPVAATLYFSPTQPILPGNSPAITPKAIEANISFDTYGTAPIATLFLGWVAASAVLAGNTTLGYATAGFIMTSAVAKGSNLIANVPFTGLLFYPGPNSVDLVTNYSGISGVAYVYPFTAGNGISPSTTAYAPGSTSNLLIAGLNTGSLFANGYTAGGQLNSNGVSVSTVAGVTTGALTLLGSSFHKYGLKYDGGEYLYAFIDGIQVAKVYAASSVFDTTQALAPVLCICQGGTTGIVTLVDFMAAADGVFK